MRVNINVHYLLIYIRFNYAESKDQASFGALVLEWKIRNMLLQHFASLEAFNVRGNVCFIK